MAASASSGLRQIRNFVQIAALGANEHVLGVTGILGNEIAGKQVEFFVAFLAVEDLNP
jgi:hypothetical protein